MFGILEVIFMMVTLVVGTVKERSLWPALALWMVGLLGVQIAPNDNKLFWFGLEILSWTLGMVYLLVIGIRRYVATRREIARLEGDLQQEVLADASALRTRKAP